MSHALMTVLEEYKVFVDEQQLGLDSYDPVSPGEDVLPMQSHNVEESAETNAEFGVRGKVKWGVIPITGCFDHQ